MTKKRLDILLLEKGFAETRTSAQKLVMAGEVRVNGIKAIKSSQQFNDSDNIVIDHGLQFVSRGGEKMLGALEGFNMTKLDGLVCADVGSSTGGFTDCLLQHGAKKVYAIDVGYGILHWKLRNDPRVIVMEKTNARNIQSLPEQVNLIVIDASFISLKLILPVIKNWYGENGGKLITLIKPQFEAGKEEAAKGAGVIKDHSIHRKVLNEILNAANSLNFGVENLIKSPLIGPKGNIEFLALFTYPGKSVNIEELINGIVF